MTPTVARCRECGDTRFPAPIVCVCGSRQFSYEPITRGRVEATTQRAGGQQPVLAVVRADGGQRIVARALGSLEKGASVLIECHSEMICVIQAGSTEDEGV